MQRAECAQCVAVGLVFVELIRVVVVHVLRGIPHAITARAKRQVILAKRLMSALQNCLTRSDLSIIITRQRNPFVNVFFYDVIVCFLI